MRRWIAIPMLCLAFLSCTEPPPPVAAFILDRVTTERVTVSLGSRSAEVVVARVPGGFFTNTARPVLGRTFSEADYTTSPSVSIISYALWERFGSGASSEPLMMNGKSFDVIGVMPDGFDIPPDAQVWIPL